MKVVMEAHRETETLIRQAQEGDRNAFDRLMAKCTPALESTVRLRLGGYLRHKIEVDDVLQETFLKAYESVSSFEYRGEDSFLNWLKKIAENLLLYWAREHRRASQLPLIDSVTGGHTSPSRRLRREERFQRLQDVLSRLNDEQREVVLLARVESIPLKEIARRLNKTPDAVRQILWRALQKLRFSFGDTESLSLPSRDLDERQHGSDGGHVER